MKGSRFSEEQIIGVLREQEAGAKTRGGVPAARDLERDLLQVEGEVRRAGGLGGPAAEGAGGREPATEEAAGRVDAGQRGAQGPARKKRLKPAARREAVSTADGASRAESATRMQAGRDRSFDPALSVADDRTTRHCASDCGSWPRSADASAIGGWAGCWRAKGTR